MSTEDRVEDRVAHHGRSIEDTKEHGGEVAPAEPCRDHLPQANLGTPCSDVRRKEAADERKAEDAEHGAVDSQSEFRDERAGREGEDVEIAREPEQADCPPFSVGSLAFGEGSDADFLDIEALQIVSELVKGGKDAVGGDGSPLLFISNVG